MARMIPPYVPTDCRSPGERILFQKFRDDPATSRWIVFHSLGIARHPKRFEGEIDFVVMIPGEGVLCIEVKAGDVSRQKGVWVYGNGRNQLRSTVGPFRQASEAMYALRRYVTSQRPDLQHILFTSSVFFTYVNFKEQSPEWHSWQVVDRSALQRSAVSTCCIRVMREAHQHALSKQATWYSSEFSRPTASQVNIINSCIRDDFEYLTARSEGANTVESEICHLTEEQFGALDALRENRQILFHGPAGTGKTFLAMEAARRYVLDGCRTMLVCYNKLLGQWLLTEMRRRYAGEIQDLTVCSLHRYLHGLVGTAISDNSQSDFWDSTLPAMAADHLLDGQREASFDAIVIDEAQDLLTDSYLDVFDLLLEGGLTGGRWAMFGDLEKQQIFVRPHLSSERRMAPMLDARSASYFRFPLRINCRNTAQIAAAVELVSGMSPGYTKIRQPVQGADVEVSFYSSEQDQQERLSATIRKFLQSFTTEQVVVLSIKRDELCAASRLQHSDKSISLIPFRDGMRRREIGFCSVHAFKGMEAAAIILTDIEALGTEEVNDLLYVGMSRAKVQLTLLMHDRCRTDWVETLRKGLSKKGAVNS